VRRRIVLADGQALVAEAFACLLSRDFEVAGVATDGQRLVEQAARLQPAAVVTDVSLPRLGGFAAAERILRQRPAPRVLFLTSCEDPRVAARAFAVGASGYALRGGTTSQLVRALKAVLRGENWLAPSLAGGDPAALSVLAAEAGPVQPEPMRRLSPRTREVVQLIAEGRSMKETAAVLGITPRTVAYHKYGAMERLAVRSTAQLVRFAVESRLLEAAGS
jgi:DNA-binding NarL/FixJ family response regulator